MRKVGLIVIVMIIAIGGSAFARGQEETPPEIDARSGLEDQDQYFSQEIDGSYAIAIEPTAGAVDQVDYILIAVRNEANEIVWSDYLENETRRGGFGQLLENIGLAGERSSITFENVPRERTWDGTYGVGEDLTTEVVENTSQVFQAQYDTFFTGIADGTTGEAVPDGEYQYVVIIVYSDNTVSSTNPDENAEESTIYVDNTVPVAAMSIVEPGVGATNVFAPGSEINGAKTSIDLSITVPEPAAFALEEQWTLQFIDESGFTVLSTLWDFNEEPEDYTWDGTDSGGEIVPDGSYTVQLTGIDRAGNTDTFLTDDPIVVDAATRSLQLSALAPNAIVPDKDAFSPNGDGIQDTLVLSFAGDQEMLELLATNIDTEISGGPVRVALTDADGEAVTEWNTIAGEWSDSAEPFVFDGSTADGGSLDEGVYTATASFAFQNGMSISSSLQIVLDTTPPAATGVSITPDLFSPNGDGLVDTVQVAHTVSPVDPSQYVDGVYTVDQNVPADLFFGVVLMEEDVQAVVAFIPGIGNGAAFSPQLIANLANSYYPQAGLSAQQIVYAGPAPPDQFSWNGELNGSVVENGTYTYYLVAVDTAGNLSGVNPSSATITGIGTPPSVTVDNRATDFRLAATNDTDTQPLYVSPNDDGVGESVTIAPTLRVAEQIESYTYEIVAEDGSVVRTHSGSGVPEAFVWSGENDSAGEAPDGPYTGRLALVYEKGDEPTAQTAQFMLDRTRASVSVSVAPESFSPNGDSRSDSVTITPEVPNADELASYSLQVQNSAGSVVRTFGGNRPQTVTWDGRGDNGGLAPNGEYTVVVSTTMVNRSTQEATATVSLDATVPTVTVSADLASFTPNEDGVADTITITPTVEPSDQIESFELLIQDSAGSTVRTVTGSPQPFTWDGTDDSGELVPDGRYTAVANVRRTNEAEAQGSSDSIILTTAEDADTIPPEVALRINPPIFSPDGDGNEDTVTLTLAIVDESPVDSWTIAIFDADGGPVREFPVGGDQVRSLEWDGIGDDGEVVEMASDYNVVYSVTDLAGNTTAGDGVVSTDIYTERLFDQDKISVPNIIFQGFTAVFEDWDEEYSPRNTQTLDRMAQMLAKFPDYRIELHGHAVSLLYEDPAEAELEQEQTLLPLSEDRALAIRDALVLRGVSGERIDIKFWGGSRPIVPFTNLEERRINRRVEFYLLREE